MTKKKDRTVADNIMDAVKPHRKETELYGPMLQFLNSAPNTIAWRHDNGGRWNPAKGRFLQGAHHQPGIPDILGVKKGRPFAIEVKLPGNDLSDAQRDWCQKFMAAGGIAYMCNGLNDVIETWKDI